MDINSIYSTIIEKLKASNNLEVIDGLENAMASASTDSEGLGLTGKYLYDLKRNNPVVYRLIKEKIKEYLTYCRQNGLIIK